jgi:hypothetical protein
MIAAAAIASWVIMCLALLACNERGPRGKRKK